MLVLMFLTACLLTLQHLCDASDKAIILDIDKLPISEALLESVGNEKALEYATTGGDDYELAFHCISE